MKKKKDTNSKNPKKKNKYLKSINQKERRQDNMMIDEEKKMEIDKSEDKTVEITDISSKVQSEGYWIGERVVEIDMGEGKEMTVPELAVETSSKLNNMGIYSILFTGHDNVKWDTILAYMEYMHEHYKISVNTSGERKIPVDFFQKERTFITLQPSFKDTFDFSTFEHNVLRVTKNEYWNFQISFEVESSDDIEKSLDMLAQMVTPKNLTIVYSPPDAKTKKHLKLLQQIKDYCTETQMSPAYDIRVLPKINSIID